jgi:hypothetical protein
MRSALLAAIDQAYDHASWHGTNLRGSLRRVSARQAARRPGRQRHNIWEIAVHCAYWKYAVLRKITGQKRGSFALTGSNWFARRVALTERAWRDDLKLLDDTHRAMRAAIAALPESRLRATARSGKSIGWLIQGIAAHDLYHAGQIQLIKKLGN